MHHRIDLRPYPILAPADGRMSGVWGEIELRRCDNSDTRADFFA